MSRNISEPSDPKRIRKNEFGIKTVSQQPLAFKWWTPGCDETDESDAAAGCTGDEPALVNAFAQPSVASGLERFAFRIHGDGSLQFKGHLDVSGATNNTVALTLPGANAGETDFLALDIENDQVHPVMVTTTGGIAGVVPARAHVDVTTGDVTITWGTRYPQGFISGPTIAIVANTTTLVTTAGSLIEVTPDQNYITAGADGQGLELVDGLFYIRATADWKASGSAVGLRRMYLNSTTAVNSVLIADWQEIVVGFSLDQNIGVFWEIGSTPFEYRAYVHHRAAVNQSVSVSYRVWRIADRPLDTA